MECEWVKDLSGKAVALTQTGSYFANVGEMTIKADGSIATRLISSYEGSDSAVADIQNAWVASVDDMLGEKIAVADTNFYISDPETGKRRIRMAETNLGDFVADGIYSYFNEVEQLHCDIAITVSYTHLDVYKRQVDDIRDLRDETAYTPSACKYKVYIIDEAVSYTHLSGLRVRL